MSRRNCSWCMYERACAMWRKNRAETITAAKCPLYCTFEASPMYSIGYAKGKADGRKEKSE